MKKYVLIFAAAVMVLSVAMPAVADVEFLYGGQFRFRINSSDGNMSGTEEGGYYGNFAPQAYSTAVPGKPNGYWNANDNRRYIDQRLRLYFTFQGSPNLKVVTKFEVGDTTWGDPGVGASALGQRTGQNGGGQIGADSTSIEVKNAYLQFNVPRIPTTSIIGIQTITLLDSWILDDDFSAAVFVTKLDPFRVTVGYIGGQYGAERRYGSGSPPMSSTSGFDNTFLAYTNQSLNLDTVFGAVDFSCAPWKATVVGLFQDGHQTTTSFDPTTLNTPVTAYTGFSNNGFLPNFQNISQNNLFDLGVNVTYKTDWLLGYVNFVQNLGSVSYVDPIPIETLGKLITTGTNKGKFSPRTDGTLSESDYHGYMIDAGLTYFCTPFTFNVGGFVTSGPEFSSNVGSNGIGSSSPAFNTGTKAVTARSLDGAIIKVQPGGELPGSEIAPFRMMTSTDVSWFTYPLATAKYSSEIIGGGVLGDDVYIERGYKQGIGAGTIESGGPGAGGLAGTMYWRGYGFPSNLYTINAGTSYQLCPGTKLSASYWYWGTPDAVPVAFDQSSLFHISGPASLKSGLYGATAYQMSSTIGNELNFYVDQKVVDNLTLTLVGAYLFADPAFCPLPVPTATVTGTGATQTVSIFGTGLTQINAAKYLTPANTDSWKLGARLQWNF